MVVAPSGTATRAGVTHLRDVAVADHERLLFLRGRTRAIDHARVDQRDDRGVDFDEVADRRWKTAAAGRRQHAGGQQEEESDDHARNPNSAHSPCPCPLPDKDHPAPALARQVLYTPNMCRNIRPLFNFEPPVTDDEVRAASLQFVRKISGFTKPSKANEDAFDRAIDEVAAAARRLMDSLVTNAPPRDRDVEAEKARARAAERYGR